MKKWLAIILSIVMILSVTACGNDGEGSEAAGDEVYTIKWAHAAAPDFPTTLAIDEIAKEIEEASDGRLIIENYHSSQLGDEAEVFEGVQMGTIEMCNVSTGSLSGYYAPILALCTPFAMTKDEGRTLLDGSVGEWLAEDIEVQAGVKCLGLAENGIRNFTSSGKQIVLPSDLEGMRIRTQDNFVTIDMVEVCGGNATPIAFGELYTALSQNAVDGQENPVAQIYSQKFYEVQDYLTIDEHMYDAAAALINPDFYNSLPEDLQNILTEYIGGQYVQREREIADEQYDEQIAEIEASGTTVYVLTDEERQEWVEATAGCINEVRKQCGDTIVDLILEGVEAIREGTYE